MHTKRTKFWLGQTPLLFSILMCWTLAEEKNYHSSVTLQKILKFQWHKAWMNAENLSFEFDHHGSVPQNEMIDNQTISGSYLFNKRWKDLFCLSEQKKMLQMDKCKKYVWDKKCCCRMKSWREKNWKIEAKNVNWYISFLILSKRERFSLSDLFSFTILT